MMAPSNGANLIRPPLQRLLADIQAGRVDCVVIYKVDRLSRSLFDFARIVQILEKHGLRSETWSLCYCSTRVISFFPLPMVTKGWSNLASTPDR